MTEVVEFSIPGRAPAATSPNSRKSWPQKHADGSEYGALVQAIAQSAKPGWARRHECGEIRINCDCPADFPLSRATVTLTQYAVRLRDHDNFAGSFKPGLDAIVRAGIIADDKPSVIDLVLKAVKVKHERDERVIVKIERLEAHDDGRA